MLKISLIAVSLRYFDTTVLVSVVNRKGRDWLLPFEQSVQPEKIEQFLAIISESLITSTLSPLLLVAAAWGMIAFESAD
jgi:hypothetical protein